MCDRRARRAEGVLPGDLGKPRKDATGDVENGLRQRRCTERPDTLVTEHHDGATDAFYGLRAHPIKRAVGHLAEDADERRAPRQDRNRLAEWSGGGVECGWGAREGAEPRRR